MKKYIKPSVVIYKMEVRCAILDGSGTPSVSQTSASSSTEVLSREDSNLWEDDDNE